MYFTYGWPKILSAFPGGAQEDIIYLQSDQDYLVVVSVTSIQLWTGGEHRVRRGQLTRDEASLKQEGLNRKAFWSSSKKLLAVLVGTLQVRQRCTYFRQAALITCVRCCQCGSFAVFMTSIRALHCAQIGSVCASCQISRILQGIRMTLFNIADSGH